MEEELAKLVYDSKNYNQYFVYKIYNIIQSKLDIDYVKLLFSNENNSDKLAYYNSNNNEIVFNIHNVNKYFDKYSNEAVSKYFYSLLIINIFLHEFEHVKQNKLSMYNEDLEGIIIYNTIFNKNDIYEEFQSNKLINKINSIRKMNLLKKLYQYSPVERLAYINSYETTSSISDLLKDYKTSFIFKDRAFNTYVYGYNKLINKNINCPTKYYFNRLGIDINNEIDFHSKNLQTLDKFKYGLDINDNDLDYLKECLIRNEIKLKMDKFQ